MSKVAVDAGERDRLVIIQQLTESRAESGFPVEAWTPLTTAYLSKEELSGRERFTANQLTAPYDTRWIGPYRSDMDPDVVNTPRVRQNIEQICPSVGVGGAVADRARAGV